MLNTLYSISFLIKIVKFKTFRKILSSYLINEKQNVSLDLIITQNMFYKLNINKPI